MDHVRGVDEERVWRGVTLRPDQQGRYQPFGGLQHGEPTIIDRAPDAHVIHHKMVVTKSMLNVLGYDLSGGVGIKPGCADELMLPRMLSLVHESKFYRGAVNIICAVLGMSNNLKVWPARPAARLAA